jgi:hypothetical protein
MIKEEKSEKARMVLTIRYSVGISLLNRKLSFLKP